MKFSVSFFSRILLALIFIYSCSTEEESSIPPTNTVSTPEPVVEEESSSDTQNQTTQDYYSVSFEGNGTYQRESAPSAPLDYSIELVSGEKNTEGLFAKGSKIRLVIEENPGWELAYDELNEIAQTFIDQGIEIENDLLIKLDVFSSSNTFPYDELNADGSFLNVGNNIGSYEEWNEPNEELNYYTTDNFFYPEYVEAYKDRVFEIRQLLGKWGPLDILIYDWEGNAENNREMYLKTREDRAQSFYEKQIISSPENWVQSEMERYDETVINNGWPFGSADAPMGGRKQIGSIFKNNYMEYVDMWSNVVGTSKESLVESDEFHWEWDSGGYHEYIHIWQASQNKHGFISEIGGCHNCNSWSERDPGLNAIWTAPRWFQEGQCAVIQSILSEKMEYRIEQGHCCTIPPQIFKVRDYIERALLNTDLDRLRRDETDLEGYYTVGEAAGFYKFAKMNYSLETFMEFEVKRGSEGYAAALESFLGMTEEAFYNEFNNWYFDSGLTNQQKLDFLYPEGLNPISMDIQKRR